MRNQNAGTGNYTSGTLTMALWNSSLDDSRPDRPLVSKTFPATGVPENGWLTYGGFSLTLQGGSYYWIVLSTTSNSTFSLSRLTSPYESLVKVSDDGGRIWRFPSEGPSAYSFRVVLSRETLGPSVSDIPQVQISESGGFAEPLQVQADTQVKGVYIGAFARQHSTIQNDHLVVSINPDDGRGGPSKTVLASGIYYGDNMTFTSPDLVQFTSVARLTLGKSYWIVIQPVGGSYYLFPVVYWERSSNSTRPNAMTTSDNGFTWQRYGGQTTILSYMLASPVQPNPTYNTKQLFQDLQLFHSFQVDATPLKGWNAYVQSSELKLMNEVGTWFQKYTGAKWEIAASAQPAVLREAGYPAITRLPLLDPFVTCEDLQQYLLTRMPITDAQFYNFGNMRLLTGCTALPLANFAQMLGYIHFYSNASATRVWQVGGMKQGSNLLYSISGSVGGPILVWISNAGQAPEKFSLSLNGTDFALGKRWATLDLTNMGTNSGTGQSIDIDKTIPARSWVPVVIVPYQGNFVVNYADATIMRQLQYPNQGLYTTEGPKNQSILLLISSNSPLEGVLLNSKENLSSTSVLSIYSSSTAGWHYDNASGMLLVKFPSSGVDSLRVLSLSPPVVPPPVLPISTLLYGLAAFLVIDVVVIAIFKFVGWRRRAAR
jgi:hypothetical protein